MSSGAKDSKTDPYHNISYPATRLCDLPVPMVTKVSHREGPLVRIDERITAETPKDEK